MRYVIKELFPNFAHPLPISERRGLFWESLRTFPEHSTQNTLRETSILKPFFSSDRSSTTIIQINVFGPNQESLGVTKRGSTINEIAIYLLWCEVRKMSRAMGSNPTKNLFLEYFEHIFFTIIYGDVHILRNAIFQLFRPRLPL